MKILFASTSSGSRGGGEIYLLYLARALARRGHEVSLWCAAHPRMDELAALFTPSGSCTAANTKTPTTTARAASPVISIFAGPNASRANGASSLRISSTSTSRTSRTASNSCAPPRATHLPCVTTIHLTQTARYLRAVMAGLRDLVAHRALSAWRWPMVCVLPERERDLVSFLGPRKGISSIANGVELYDLSQRPPPRGRQAHGTRSCRRPAPLLRRRPARPAKAPPRFSRTRGAHLRRSAACALRVGGRWRARARMGCVGEGAQPRPRHPPHRLAKERARFPLRH